MPSLTRGLHHSCVLRGGGRAWWEKVGDTLQGGQHKWMHCRERTHLWSYCSLVHAKSCLPEPGASRVCATDVINLPVQALHVFFPPRSDAHALPTRSRQQEAVQRLWQGADCISFQLYKLFFGWIWMCFSEVSQCWSGQSLTEEWTDLTESLFAGKNGVWEPWSQKKKKKEVSL